MLENSPCKVLVAYFTKWRSVITFILFNLPGGYTRIGRLILHKKKFEGENDAAKKGDLLCHLKEK